MCFVLFSDTTVIIGGALCYFALDARVVFLAMRMEFREGAWGKDAPSFDWERRPWEHLRLLSFRI